MIVRREKTTRGDRPTPSGTSTLPSILISRSGVGGVRGGRGSHIEGGYDVGRGVGLI